MKIVAALLTALTLVGFGGAALACDGYSRTGDTAQNNEKIIPPAERNS